MILPKRILIEAKSPKGQAMILFLLILVVGLGIVLSVASRTVTDIRTTTASDESNRAYFAAEAGIEEALGRLKSSAGPVPKLDLNFPDLSARATTTVNTSVGEREIYVVPFDVKKDDVAQVNMLDDPNVPTAGWMGDTLNVYWGNDPATFGTDQAIEVTLLIYTGNFAITKWIFDPDSTRRLPLNFCAPNAPSPIPGGIPLQDSVTGLEKTFYYSATIDIVDSDPPGTACKHGPGKGDIPTPVFLRIRPLFNDNNPIPVAVKAAPSSPPLPLPGQEQVIESTGRTVSGVTRKIRVTRTFPALPAIFDYVLFSGETGPLKK